MSPNDAMNPIRLLAARPQAPHQGGAGWGHKRLVRKTRLANAALLAAILASAMSGLARGDDDARFLQGLRDRGLYTTAEHFCQVQAERDDIPLARRAALIIQWADTLSEHALHSRPDDRAALWDKAEEITTAFIKEHPDHSRTLVVRLQRLMALSARGRLMRQETGLVSGGEVQLEAARKPLRQAVRGLEELDQDISEALRRLARNRTAAMEDGELSEDEMLSLQKHVQYHWARAQAELAHSYPAGTPDRAGPLAEAVTQLRVLARLPTTHPLGWESRLALIDCHRLLGDYALALGLLDDLSEEEPPPEVSLRARAQRLRIALAQERWDEADRLIALGRTLDGQTSPRLDYALLEAFVEGWKKAQNSEDPQQAEPWKERITELVSVIARQHGAYWKYRAEMLVARSVEQTPRSDDAAMQVWVAENAYRAGRYDEAIAAYDRAREAAAAAGDTEQAFRLGYTAATIEHRRNEHREAWRRYRELAVSLPEEPQAADAHRLAQYHCAQLLRNDPQNKELQGEYIELLREFLEHWPGISVAEGIRYRLARMLQLNGRYKEAVEAFAQIPPQSEHAGEAVAGLEACYTALLEAENGAARAEHLDEALSHLVGMGGNSDRLDPANPQQQAARLAWARLQLRFGDPQAVARELARLLEAIPENHQGASELRQRVSVYLATAALLTGNPAEAQQYLQPAGGSLAELPTALRCELVRILYARLGENTPARSGIAQWTATLAESLQGAADLPHDLASSLTSILAESLAAAGREAEALARYRRLASQHPNNGEIQEAYATLLARRDDRTSLEEALEVWRTVEQKSREGTPRWYRAKLAVADLHRRLGRPEQALKIISLLEVVHPDLGGPKLAEQFRQLRRLCRQ